MITSCTLANVSIDSYVASLVAQLKALQELVTVSAATSTTLQRQLSTLQNAHGRLEKHCQHVTRENEDLRRQNAGLTLAVSSYNELSLNAPQPRQLPRFQQLPPELVQAVVSHCKRADLARLASTATAFYAPATEMLFTHLELPTFASPQGAHLRTCLSRRALAGRCNIRTVSDLCPTWLSWFTRQHADLGRKFLARTTALRWKTDTATAKESGMRKQRLCAVGDMLQENLVPSLTSLDLSSPSESEETRLPSAMPQISHLALGRLPCDDFDASILQAVFPNLNSLTVAHDAFTPVFLDAVTSLRKLTALHLTGGTLRSPSPSFRSFLAKLEAVELHFDRTLSPFEEDRESSGAYELDAFLNQRWPKLRRLALSVADATELRFLAYAMQKGKLPALEQLRVECRAVGNTNGEGDVAMMMKGGFNAHESTKRGGAVMHDFFR